MMDAETPKHTPQDTMTDKQSLTDTLLDTAFTLIEKKGWLGLDLIDIARAAGVTLGDVYTIFSDKGSILVVFHRKIDRCVLEYGVLEKEEFEQVRDRIFEVLMRRFEVLRPYRGALVVLVEDWGEDCVSLLKSVPQFMTSMEWMLRLALVSRNFLPVVIGGIFLRVLRIWIKDDSRDMSSTMVALDKDLRKVEFLLPRDGVKGSSSKLEDL